MSIQRSTSWICVAVALALVACGRTELEVPLEDIARPDATDVIADRPDRPPICRTNAECDDGVFCNGTEQCVAGSCRPGIPVACDDGVDCTRDACDESTGTCVVVPDDARCVAPARCDVRRGCTTVACANNAECDDGNVCNGVERCAAGVCVAGAPLRCDDGVDCTVDRCDPRVGCVAIPNDARCDDGVFCNGVERCSTAARGCVGSMPILCEDGDPCTAERCDERSRTCVVTGRGDNDNDGFISVRCGGDDCDDNNRNVNPGRPESTPETCLDGLDNNCNGLTDCREMACAARPECGGCIPTGPEGPPGTCRDGRDNDCNRLIDCADPACRASAECGVCTPTGPERDPIACSDGRDNDCDGRVDCADTECALVPSCMMCVPTGPEGTPASCNDGRDNDCNGATDCADVACAMTPVCAPTNEDCATARPISLPGTVSGSTLGARDDFTPSCSAGSRASDVVWVFRNPVRQTITIDTVGSSYDTMLMVRRDNCMGPDLACDDDSGGALSSRIVLTDADPGTYYVIVDGFAASSGAYRLRLSVGTTEVCDNGLDDDGDGLVDCMDGDCAASPACMVCTPVARSEIGFCTGGRDEDCDGQIDCVDPDCRLDPACSMCVPTGPESNPAACSDGRDNDCDRLIDCADPDCRGVPGCGCVPTGPENNAMACLDGRDNDCDGQTDCADSECATVPACMVCMPTGRENTAAACSDGRDNDCDRLIDCADPECSSQLVCCRPTGAENTDAACSDGRDNDCDGRVDCADAECSGLAMCACVISPEVCTDGRDNDCDRLIDCADPDCAANPACMACVPTGPEMGDVACSDGRDNDCDRLTDCADPECSTAFACCRPTGAENTDATCSDGRDNDCDRAVDCMDPGCAMTAPCLTAPANDTCAGAQSVAVPSVTTGSTVGARNNYQPVIAGFPGCAGGSGPDVVYTFSVRVRTPITIDVAGVGFDPVLFVRRAPCESGTQTACNDDAVGQDSRVSLIADPGQYFVFVDGFGPTSQGTFRLTISTGLPAEDCGNGRDDDADMLADCADPDCSADPRCAMCVPTGPENSAAACSDGRDNDCNNLIDCADPGCRSVPSCCRPTGPEGGRAACSDGVDNDCDGQIDCADADCTPLGSIGSTECCNGRDDDGNGLVDEFACTCSSNTNCVGVGAGGSFTSPSCYTTLPVMAPAVCGLDCRAVGGSAFCESFGAGWRCNLMTGACVP